MTDLSHVTHCFRQSRASWKTKAARKQAGAARKQAGAAGRLLPGSCP